MGDKTAFEIRTICGTCCRVMTVPIRTAVLNTPMCHGKEMLIAGPAKVDRTGVTGKRGTRIDPVVLYRTARLKSSAAPERSLNYIEATFLRVMCGIHDHDVWRTITGILYAEDKQVTNKSTATIAQGILRKFGEVP